MVSKPTRRQYFPLKVYGYGRYSLGPKIKRRGSWLRLCYQKLNKTIAFILLSLVGSQLLWADPAAPELERRVAALDLRHGPSHRVVTLDGPWEFYWKQLLPPGVDDAPLGLSPVRGPWRYLGYQYLKDPLSDDGYASYRLRFKGLTPREEGYELRIPEASSALKVFIYPESRPDRISFRQVGKVGENRESTVPDIQSLVVNFHPQSVDETWVVLVHLVNFHYARGGLREFPELAPTPLLSREQASEHDGFLIGAGALLLVAVYNFMIYTRRRQDRASLLLAVFCFLLSIRSFLAGDADRMLFADPSLLLFTWRYKLEYLTVSLPPVVFAMFLTQFFPALDAWRALPWFKALAAIGSLFIIFTEAKVFTSFLWLVQISVAPCLVYNCWLIVRAVAKNLDGGRILFSGIVVISLGILYDVLVTYHVFNKPFLMQYAVIVFIGALSQAVARRFAQTFDRVEHLSHNLQSEVEHQTKRLQMQKNLLEEQQSQLIVAHQELQQLDEQKTRFFSNVSHELRTPLTLILGGLKAALHQEHVAENLDQAFRHGQRLFRLVNQLLDFQKLTMAHGHLRLQRIDLRQFVDESARYFKDMSRQRDVELRLDWAGAKEGPVEVLGHIDSLEKILFNFLSNALKFTPKGGVITIALSQVNQWARITVTDSGCGISKADQGKLFRLFSQIEGQHQKGQEGTGLGLALVKELSSKMNGKVGVYSEERQGASFWVEFPALKANAEVLDLLYVDPDPKSREFVQSFFKSHSLLKAVKTIAHPNEAHTLLNEFTIRALICSAEYEDDASYVLFNHTHSCQEECWLALVSDHNVMPAHRSAMIDASQIKAMYHKPLEESMLRAWVEGVTEVKHQQDPVLDLLYVEDDKGESDFFRLALEQLSARTRFRIVSNTDDAALVLKHHQVKVLLSDIVLGQQRGTDLLKYAAEHHPETFRIMITAQATADILEEGINKGHVHYVIYKPCNIYEEIQALQDFMNRSPIADIRIPETQEFVPRDWHFAEIEAPNVRQDPSEILPTSPLPETPSLLVLDDLADMRRLIGNTLAAAGYRVALVESGQKALDLIFKREQRFDLIVSDWMMPGMDGPEFIQILHQHEEFASIPTILLTAKSDDSSRALATRLGANAYINKPFDDLELVSTVENLLDLKKRERKIDDLNRYIAQNVLQRFLPPQLVKDIIEGRSTLDDQVKQMDVTVLFADLCNFTKSTEVLSPSAIARILNSFFIRMSQVIFDHGGTIDKFMGDGIMVIFGAPNGMNKLAQIEHAQQCALAMQEALTALNEDWRSQENYDFKMRIGMHCGSAIVGSFGGAQRSDYTVVGHTVNIASRVENLAGPGEIFVTEAVVQYLAPGTWESIGSHKVKGLEIELPLFRLQRPRFERAA